VNKAESGPSPGVGETGVFTVWRAQLSTHLLAGESPVAGRAKPPRS
jgi:hypothetical protein